MREVVNIVPVISMNRKGQELSTDCCNFKSSYFLAPAVDPTAVFLDKDSKSFRMRTGRGIGEESLSKAVSENITRKTLGSQPLNHSKLIY